jgi:SAM-dependent methyltransferase
MMFVPLVLVVSFFLLLSVTAFAPSIRPSADRATIVQLHATKRRQRNKGFGRKESHEKELPISDKSIYSLPALYDLAFGYRSYQDEVDFLLEAHEAHSSSRQAPTRVLELAAGPARHSLTALSRTDSPVKSVTAVDLSPEMKEYALQLAHEVLSSQQQDDECFEYICSDMREPLGKEETFDSAWILLGSLQHLQTNQDVVKCFSSAHDALKPGGTLILELPHPRETFSMVECTKNGWEVPLEDETGEEYGELQIVWGDETDTFDAIQQVRQFTVSFDLKTTQEKDRQSVRQIVPMRLFTAQEIDALATCSGFEVVAMYGALDKDVAVDDEDEAFRLVCVLQKV